MYFHIKHITRYAYSVPVFCEPLTVRLRPRCDAMQRLLRWRVLVDPQPAGTSEIVEADGHTALGVWFSNLTCDLAITTTSTVETLRTNPFDFLLDARSAQLPFAYSDDLAATLSPYQTPAEMAGPIASLAAELQHAANHETMAFLRLANLHIFDAMLREERPDGPAQSAADTLAHGRGTCRDFAVLFMELCRSAGIAARFVSGYEAGADDQSEHHLHAWVDVYVPGGGWRGYDPSCGLAVSDRHVAVAAACTPTAAAATTGAFRSSVARSRMETQIVLRVSDAPPPDAASDNFASQSQS